MIDEVALTNTLISVARAAVGDQLGEVIVSGSPLPAVVKARGSKDTPPYPYIVIDKLARTSSSPHGWTSEVDVDDLTVYSRREDFLYSFRCYGTKASDIINDLHLYFDLGSVRDSIRTSTSGAIYSVRDPEIDAVEVGGEYIETAMFTLVWRGINYIKDPTVSIIETVDLTLQTENSP